MIFKARDSNGAEQYGIVPIINDQIVEATESFVIRLTSIDSGLTPTSFSSATINIIDNDSKWLWNQYLSRNHVVHTITVITTPAKHFHYEEHIQTRIYRGGGIKQPL